MGLFMGASLLTLLEILDYIYEARGAARAAGGAGGSSLRQGGLGG